MKEMSKKKISGLHEGGKKKYPADYPEKKGLVGGPTRMPDPEKELGKNVHEPDKMYSIPVEDTNVRVIKDKD